MVVCWLLMKENIVNDSANEKFVCCSSHQSIIVKRGVGSGIRRCAYLTLLLLTQFDFTGKKFCYPHNNWAFTIM